MSSEIMDFVGRYQTLQGYQAASDQLMKDLLIYAKEIERTIGEENRILKQKLRNAELDLDHATISRREMQQTLSGLESDNNYLKNRNPYVLILIDGDGLLFQETYIKQGIEGGKQAAYALRSAVAEYVGSQSGEVEIIAKVCANMSGLARAMRRDGCLDSESELKEFSLGFTQAKASFDFIDVGHGKERADSKIKEATRWHLRNYNCRQILLGISHDAGYAPFLDEILQDADTRARVSLIEGFATSALENIKKRTGAAKLCNNHYLRGPCAKGDECCFEHKYRPNADEINAIAYLTRLNPCTSGQECDVENCIYGHHCPSVVGNTCTHPFCKFRITDHPPGTKFKNAKIHEN
ncbi:hypothetical protein COL154_009205 [Colletotrichum chrysophilum]|nr:hypothetical protein CBS470a_005557 [Colletotrichum nupharicola]KAJ0322178.1 hypothetical protein Brms1b_002394 [Colletotrichum noveboracense]KAJ0347594.1 hypothetical protein KNSL1_006338 [Colletotrichum chrysophilum]KAJ0358388.1 hypothetical protein COL154_009205 [Colletotrichum chrysophilum]